MPIIRTRVIKIGNSQGLRIPKLVLEQLGFEDEVELEVQENRLIVWPLQSARRDWEAQFQAMAAKGDDTLLDGKVPSLTSWDEEDWEW